MNESPVIKIQKTRNARLLLSLLFIVFLLPMILAWLLYVEKYTFSNTTNHGQLIKPSFSIRELHTNLMLNGKWIMLLFYPGRCLQSCEQDLYHLRQIRLAMGGDSDRLQWAIMTYPLHTHLPTPDADTLRLVVNPNRYAKITKQYVHTTPVTQNGTLYFIDPHGNVMIVYSPPLDPQGIFKDLQRLLKVSQIG